MRNSPRCGWLLLMTALAGLMAAAGPPRARAAGVPRTIPFQGVLTGASGQPKPNGNYTLAFRLYSAPSGGSPLWTEPAKPVSVTGGKGGFSTTLGAPTPFGTLAFDQPYYLEVQAAGDAPMTPRLPLQAVPYALGLALPLTATAAVAAPSSALSVTNSGNGIGVQGAASGEGGIGVVGKSTGTHGFGVYGSSATDIAVFGKSVSWEGVHGESQSDKGVYGQSNTWVGVWGHSNSSTGVRGETTSGFGVQGEATTGVGVSGISSTNTGVLGQSGAYPGVWGKTTTNSGTVGESTTGNGVYGVSDSDGKGHGENGVYGKANVPLKGGVYGENASSSGYGVYGNAAGFNGYGVYGAAPGSAGSRGVYGTANTGYGVYGTATGSDGTGVYGDSGRGAHGELGTYYAGGLSWYPNDGGFGAEISNFAVGVLGSSGGVGVLGIGGGTGLNAGPAGAFIGNVVVTGEVFYSHRPAPPPGEAALAPVATSRSVEATEPLDVCGGNVTLDGSGRASVALPASAAGWSSDVRYQLTPIGGPAPGLYVAEEVKDGHFRIAGGPPGAKVSWQVTGVRR